MTIIVTVTISVSSSVDAAIELPSVVGIELLVADSSDNAVESRFGHSLIRFIHDSSLPFEDTILSFEASVPTDATRTQVLWNGVIGGYTSLIRPISMIDLLVYYSQNQNRGFSRIVLRLKPEQINSLFLSAREIIQNPKSVPDYSFFNFNCARMVIWFFERSGISIELNPRIPTNLPSAFRYSLLAPWHSIQVPSGSTALQKVRHTIQENIVTINANEIARLTKDDIFFLLTGNYTFSAETRSLLLSASGRTSGSLDKIYNIQAFTPMYYQDVTTTNITSTALPSDLISNTFASRYQQSYWNAYLNRFADHAMARRFKSFLKEKRNLDLLESVNESTYEQILNLLKEI